MGEENRLDSGSSLQTATRERSTWLALEQFLSIRWIVVDASLGSAVGVSSRMSRDARMLPSSRGGDGGDLRWMALTGSCVCTSVWFGFLFFTAVVERWSGGAWCGCVVDEETVQRRWKKLIHGLNSIHTDSEAKGSRRDAGLI
jgi:hypothetical protein